MKLLAAYYLLLIYTMAVFRPAMPLMNDAMSHFFEDVAHLATVHALYGDDHVDVEITAASSENNNKAHNSVKQAEEMFAHTIAKMMDIHAYSPFYSATSFPENNNNTSAIYLPPQIKPPAIF